MNSRAWWYLVGFGIGVVLMLVEMAAASLSSVTLLLVGLLIGLCAGRLAQLAAREDRQAGTREDAA